MTKILFFAGSARQDSVNKKLAKAAFEYALSRNVEATYLDLAAYPLPIYDGDFEDQNGLPDNAKTLKQIFADHDGFFIASPEYNSSISPLLKNVIDWASRAETKDEPPLKAYKGKVVAISAASPGGLGGIRGLVPLRMLLGNIGIFVTPSQLAIPGAHNAFDDHGGLIDDHQKATLEKIVSELIDSVRGLNTK